MIPTNTDTWDDEVDSLAWSACLDLSDGCLPPGERERAKADKISPERFVERWMKATDKEYWAAHGRPYYMNENSEPAYPENDPKRA